MNKKNIWMGIIFLGTTLSASAAVKNYQVTGPILEVTDTKIVVQKGKEKWELQRDPSTEIKGDLKVGSKVTVSYSMDAKSIEAQAPKK